MHKWSDENNNEWIFIHIPAEKTINEFLVQAQKHQMNSIIQTHLKMQK